MMDLCEEHSLETGVQIQTLALMTVAETVGSKELGTFFYFTHIVRKSSLVSIYPLLEATDDFAGHF